MTKDEKQIQVVSHFRYRLEISNAFIMTQYPPIPIGSSLQLPLMKIAVVNINTQQPISKDKKEKRAFSIFSPENFQLRKVFEFQAFICTEDQGAGKHSQQTYFIKICQYKKKGKCIFISLWQAFTRSYFCCKSRKKGMTQSPQQLRRLLKKFASCTQMSCRLLTWLMLPFCGVYSRD